MSAKSGNIQGTENGLGVMGGGSGGWFFAFSGGGWVFFGFIVGLFGVF